MASSNFKYALVLFDWDGCTAVVEAKKLKPKTDVAISAHLHTRWFGKDHKVEVLELSDSKDELNLFEDQWSKSHRSEALDRVKQRRNTDDNCGYLSVWPDDEVDQSTDDQETVDPPTEPEPTEPLLIIADTLKSGVKEGLKDRKITVLHEGSGDYHGTARPTRSPFYMSGLTTDQIDLIFLQVNEFSNKKRTYATQTEKVIILKEDEDVVRHLVKKPTSSKETQTEPSEQINSDKLDEILSILRTMNENREMNSLLLQDLLPDLTLTPLPQQEHIPEPQPESQPEPILLPPKPSGTIHAEQENVMTVANCLPVTTLPVLTQMCKGRRTTSFPCRPGVITEVASYDEMYCVLPDNEVRVTPSLQRKHSEFACSKGNFAWSIAQNLFSQNEMYGRNYYGNKGKLPLSPRRTHAIEHAVTDTYGPSEDNVKITATAINTGLRNQASRGKRLVFAPLDLNI